MWSYDDKCCQVKKKKKYIFKLGPRGNKMNENEYEYVYMYRENSKQIACARGGFYSHTKVTENIM